MLRDDDGSLPEIVFDFGGQNLVAQAYQTIQSRASCLASPNAYYWSRKRECECPIHYGDDPVQAFLDGDAEGFHVVFGGLHAANGAPVPDLGVAVLGADYIVLDYRMGPAWNTAAVAGLFEIMQALVMLLPVVEIRHTENIGDDNGAVLPALFRRWMESASHLQT